MLIVVKYRDPEVLKGGFDLETLRRGDVLKVDASEGWRDQADGLDDLVRVLRVEADGPGIDVGELFEQHGLALHHWKSREGADVSESENGRSVGDDGNRVGLQGEATRGTGILGDDFAWSGHAGGVGDGEVIPSLDGHFVEDADFPTELLVDDQAAFAEIEVGWLAHRWKRNA